MLNSRGTSWRIVILLGADSWGQYNERIIRTPLSSFLCSFINSFAQQQQSIWRNGRVLCLISDYNSLTIHNTVIIYLQCIMYSICILQFLFLQIPQSPQPIESIYKQRFAENNSIITLHLIPLGTLYLKYIKTCCHTVWPLQLNKWFFI